MNQDDIMRCGIKLFLGILLTTGFGRTWTSTAGTKVEAELVSAAGEEVTLKLDTGKEITLTLSKLSAEDQAYLTSLEEKATRGMGGTPLWTNWDASFPETIRTSVSTFDIEEKEEEEGQFIYESPHFTFHSDVQLTGSLVKKFAWYFESTHAYLEALPLSLARTQETEKHRIQLFESESDYLKNGGLEGSAGVYMSGKDLVMVPLTSLGVKKVGSRYTVDYKGSNKTLSHEVVHSFTDLPYFTVGARGWFTEGLAEFVALTPYRSGIYMPSKAASYLETYITGFSKDTKRGRNLGTEIRVGSLEAFMMMPYEDFIADGNITYGVSALIVTYFLDLAWDEEKENLTSFLKALKAGKKGGESVEVLLNGRSYAELEESITKAWRSKGVKLHF